MYWRSMPTAIGSDAIGSALEPGWVLNVTVASFHGEVVANTVTDPASGTLLTHSSTVAFSTSSPTVPGGSVPRSKRTSALMFWFTRRLFAPP